MNGRLDVQVLIPGKVDAPARVLSAPLSFWGGVDSKTGEIIDVQHPQCGSCLAGQVLVLPGIRGSTAAPGALLELLAAGSGPVALLTPHVEVVPLVTALTGALLPLVPPAVAVLRDPSDLARVRTGCRIAIEGERWRVAAA
jgi:predicted aconitase with swiveling domain